jgi:RNA polymerase sigma-70 factor, ECF subfamily
MPNEDQDVTSLLERWSAGDIGALEEATKVLYSQLRLIAGSYFQTERHDHTLQPTALINEAYMRIVRLDRLSFQNRNQFLGLFAKVMRQILVDHARNLHAAKRGSGAAKVELNEALATSTEEQNVERFLILDEALTALAVLNERQARIIELRYFAGLGVTETGEVLGVSAPTVSRDQRIAEAWLNQALRSTPQSSAGAAAS